jgi:predicted O-methyltransferase YrrM
MKIDLEKIFETRWVEQCKIGMRWFLDYLERNVQPKIYLEIGCAKLGTFFIHQHLLPKDGLAIGIDVVDASEWNEYMSPNESEYCIIKGDSGSSEVLKKVKDILAGRKIDFLFIDGDHNIEAVQKDWDNYASLVRTDGVIAFHDYDWSAYLRGVKEGQGAAWICAKLHEQGYQIFTVPVGSIGVAFVKQK